jgi:hypothetical protein
MDIARLFFNSRRNRRRPPRRGDEHWRASTRPGGPTAQPRRNEGGGPPHWVDQSAATFDNAAVAKDFVADQVAQWRRCAGRKLTYAYPRPDDWQDTYRIGETIDSGCVTMVSNVITGDKQYTDIRALAAKSNVVVDLQFTGFDLTDEPALAINRILDRIASQGHECAFWA